VLAAPAPGYGPPPGLEVLSPSDSTSTRSDTWTVTSVSSRTPSVNGSSWTSDGGSIGQTPAQTDFGDGFPTADAVDLEDDMAELRIHPDAWEVTTDGWGTGEFDYNQAAYGAPEDEEPQENLWADYAVPVQPVMLEPEIMCKVHGKLCSKGICKEYKRQLREIERQKEIKAREEAEAQKKANKKNKKKNKQEGKYFEVGYAYREDGTEPGVR
jgi:hypothetical protein